MTKQKEQRGNAVLYGIIAIIIIGGGIFAWLGLSRESGEVDTGQDTVMEEKDKGDAMMEKKEDTTAMMDEAPAKDAMMKEVDEAMAMAMKEVSYEYSGNLIDVTKGATILGISTNGQGSGQAQAGFVQGEYNLLATFANIPDPLGSDFYEGWVVRKEPFAFISTGKAEKKNGVYTNMYISGTDLREYDFYVLTIEPDDGDPAPADHIVEGTMVKQSEVMEKDEGDAMMEEKDEGEAMMEPSDATSDEAAMEDKDDAMQEDNSNKINFSGAVLAGTASPLIDFNPSDYNKALSSDKLVVLYFYANWCPICKKEVADALYPAFNELSGENVVGFRVNYKDSDTDKNEEALAKEFGVAYQHTKVFLQNSQRVLKSPTSWDKQKYLDEINNLN